MVCREQLQDALVLAMVNEASRLVEADVVGCGPAGGADGGVPTFPRF